ncbi:oxidoreductase [Caulobacter sp. CCUG 60055]|uniref:SDR family NAD(P)-dependent oxidoreductase n=1 Tax=Caulobacter sp. CCUG 60055 TaxID=2100090 RepID=UPI001FA708D7|nr:SDR family NAD(P)-dependent oxidoreductase [Caulobacter sp. CCUG 60055]MBQ1543996.1 SDR family NAD(P)-dependent oxidoreductase [Caulobacteraceae bacterium]MCI3180545.1 oxidoreductase [Caulobacter sp. CCUG 60055]
MKSVVVTGASTGIGYACVETLTASGFHVFGGVRRREDADRLAQAFGDRFTPLIFDVTDEAAVAKAADQTREALAGETLGGLVNNAGVAVAGPLLHLPVAEFRRQIEINLIGVMVVTQAFAPLAGARPDAKGPPGRIVNISSVGGRNAMPFLGPYNASKFGLEGFSESLRRELLIFGVDVVVVAPGAVATPIWDKAEQVDVTPYQATAFAPALGRIRDYMVSAGAKGLKPAVIGRTVLEALTAAKPRVRYTVAPDPFQVLLTQILPKRTLDRAVGRRLGLTPQARGAG